SPCRGVDRIRPATAPATSVMKSAYTCRRTGTVSAGGFMGRRPGGLGDAVTILIAALVRGDQFGQEADRHHLCPKQQGGDRVNEQRALMQWQERPRWRHHVRQPGNSEIRHSNASGKET